MNGASASGSASAAASAAAAAAAVPTNGVASARRCGQPAASPSPSSAAAAAATGVPACPSLIAERWDAARAVTTQIDACMRADQWAAGEAQVTTQPYAHTGTAAAAAATTAAAAAAASAPAPSVTVYRRYRITLVLECGPSLLATLQPGSARILSQVLGCACRRALAQMHHAAAKVTHAHPPTRPRTLAQPGGAIRPALQMHRTDSLLRAHCPLCVFPCFAVRPLNLRDSGVRVRGRSSQRAAVLQRAGQQLPIGKRRSDQRGAVADTYDSCNHCDRPCRKCRRVEWRRSFISAAQPQSGAALALPASRTAPATAPQEQRTVVALFICGRSAALWPLLHRGLRRGGRAGGRGWWSRSRFGGVGRCRCCCGCQRRFWTPEQLSGCAVRSAGARTGRRGERMD